MPIVVKEGTVRARVDKALRKHGRLLLRINSRSEWVAVLGHYILVNGETREVEQSHIELADIASTLGVLAPHERLGA